MIIKETTQVGNKIIRAKSKAVSNPTSKTIRKIVRDLVDSMRSHGLVGMAAPQIGRGARVFVTEIRETELRKNVDVGSPNALKVFINPRILSVSKKKVGDWEGCGSVAFANLFGIVKRPTSVTVEALDKKGNKFLLRADGLLARVIQHEMDHLNGIVFTDKADVSTYMSRNERLKSLKR